ncbi:YfjI family protein [Botrimarina mediterranea]|uniref:DUF3987 domain-containing protein n=1 Tax=Botrimarina mediterranea TaxID=2528022 RepID=A0A518KD23_9BACT|nr:YfjI family protein [Botrimarina mediterranea]QDV75700.1 hypothetical protein Spa11_39210 [Botrimarina mediterranea]
MTTIDIAVGETGRDGEHKVVAVSDGRVHLDRFDPAIAWKRTKFAEAAVVVLGLDADAVSEIEARIATEVVKADLAAVQKSKPDTVAAAPPDAWRPFPTDSLPARLAEFTRTAARSIGCDESFIALPVLAVCGAAIGTTRRVLLKPGWAEPLCIWAAIVGESGSQKTPAFSAAIRPLKRRQAELMKAAAAVREAFDADVAEYEKALAVWKRERGDSPAPSKPVPFPIGRVLVGDATVESLGPILNQNPRGVLLARDELAGWLDFDRYSKNGKGGSDVSHWLSWFNAQPTVIDRRSNPDPLFVPEAVVGIVGGIQPRVLDRAIGGDHRENGLLARLLLAYPPRQPKKWSEHGLPPEEEDRYERLVMRLYDLQHAVDDNGDPEPMLLTLDAEAKRLLVEFVNAHGREAADLTGDESAAYAKLEAYAARLAGVLHLVRWADGDVLKANRIDGVTMAAAVRLVEWFKREVRRVYRVLRESDDARDQRRIAEWIALKGGSATVREVQRGFNRLKTAADAEAVLQALVAAGVGAWESVGPGERGGRPTRRFSLTDAVTDDTTPLGTACDAVLSPEASGWDDDGWEAA